jgi:dTDP-glucose pyrophosphorylase
MKALILAGGRGNRLGEITEPQNKCLLEFHGKPLIEYSLEAARVACLVDEIVIVVGYKAESIINRYGIEFRGLRIKYVIQQELKGLVHAIEQCQETLEGHDFILFLADEIIVNPRHQEMIDTFEGEDLFAICGVTLVQELDHIKKTYAVIHNPQDGRIFRLIEKPRNPINNIMGTGNCIFRNEIFGYIPRTPINQTRHERELPDLIQCAIDDGEVVKLFFVGSQYVNINTPDDIVIAENLNSSGVDGLTLR